MADEKTYVCLGTCQAVITEEQYKSITACGADSCTLKGHPFVEGKKNPETGKNEATK